MALQLVHLRKMFDASNPPNHIPPSDVVAFYIGGDTPHVWTDAEIKAVPDRWRLPIWVRSNPNGSTEGTSEGREVVKWLESHHVPKGCTVALDLETAIDNGYVHAFNSELLSAGYETLAYGSTSTLFQNSRPSAGYWAAEPGSGNGLPAGLAAKQYEFDGGWDLSVVADSLVLWEPNAPIPVPNPVPVPTPIPAPIPVETQDTITISVPVLSQGDREIGVGTIQALLDARLTHEANLVIDDDFGPLTHAALVHFQEKMHLPASGVANGATWKALILGVVS